jgi:hypothetical protein
MKIIFRICVDVSIGIISGFIFGILKASVIKRAYTDKQIRFLEKLKVRFSNILKYVTFLLLLLGLLWCGYFLILGIAVPQQAEYANNMSELIVGLLTVISILFAFVEFLQKKGDKE